jgi:hypothetical protein
VSGSRQGVEATLGHRGQHGLGVQAAPEPEDGGHTRDFAEVADVLAGGNQRHGHQPLVAEVGKERGHNKSGVSESVVTPPACRPPLTTNSEATKITVGSGCTAGSMSAFAPPGFTRAE